MAFKVVIAGAGVAGLTLANMLEKLDIDYIVLEAYRQIAPQVGASIGLFPNGLRILDQIDCYEPIRKLAEDALKDGNIRDKSGKVISSMENMSEHMIRRHGYEPLFFDRQMLLQILYNRLQHKERVLPNKRVVKIDHVEGGVNVTAADGEVFTGTLIVGADGVHSTVRGEMIKMARELQPKEFGPDDNELVPCYYKCSFGIAQNVPGWVPTEQNIVLGEGNSLLVVSGPENRVYWFIFEKLPEVKYGSDIPKYSKDDEAEFVKKNINLPITEKVTFGQVFAKRTSSTLTPLHEFVYKKWFFKRIILLGDSAHKPNPIGGQGGNGALESMAELINATLRKRAQRDGSLGNLSDQDIEDIFKETQAARHDRADLIVRLAHEAQALNAFENPVLSTLVWKVLAPYQGSEFSLNQVSTAFMGASTLKDFPVPHRPRAIPYDDELPATPIGVQQSKIVRNVFIGGMGLIILVTKKAFRLPFPELTTWGETGIIDLSWPTGGFPRAILSSLVSVFSIPLMDKDPAPRIHLMNFLTQLISPILIYTIEGYRLGNQGTILSLPSIFTGAMQLQGIGCIAPLHGIMSAFFTHQLPTGRAVPTEVANVLTTALTLGYLLPTILSFSPSCNLQSWQNWVALWQFAPPLFNVLTFVFSTGLRRWQRGSKSKEEYEKEHIFDRYKTHDVGALKSVYTFAFVVQSTSHIATIAYAWTHPEISIFKMFFDVPNPFKATWSLPSLSEKIAVFFKYDMLTAVVAIAASNLYSVWTLRRQGYVKTSEAIKAAISVVAGQFLVGSGATWAALWHWRESKLTGLSTIKEHSDEDQASKREDKTR
ncbi:FAD binding domain protein [Ilyonectria destructans]|nr:FAD binding domain protein [Ilyonectria destructans]